MSDENKAETELNEMREQLVQAAAAQDAQATQQETESPPEVPTAPAAEAQSQEETPVAPPSEGEQPKDDPLKWAEKKGYRSPEDMARALLQKEQEFHQSRQKQNEAPPQMPPPAWNPAPQAAPWMQAPPPQYGYPPPMPPPLDRTRLAQQYGVDPDDFDKIARIAADMATAATSQERRRYESEMSEIRRNNERQNELMQLMQDPAFKTKLVQDEMEAVVASDPTIYQRMAHPNRYAFGRALENLGRKQLQQGTSAERNPTPSNMPPVTAGGGNGSASSNPAKPTEREFARWSLDDQTRYIKSNGRVLPKR